MSTTIKRMLQELMSAGNIQTPAYIVSYDVLRYNVNLLIRSFTKKFQHFTLGYSYKTNYSGDILRKVHHLGAYAEVVSPMELEHARNFVRDSRIIYNGVIPDTANKFAVAANGGMVNIENMTELLAISEYAGSQHCVIDVGIRVNLNIDGLPPSRFGIEITPETFRAISQLKNINVAGVHCHVTQSRELSYWTKKAEMMARLAKMFGSRYIDLGGNMYGPMNPELAKQFKEAPPTFDDYAECIYSSISKVYGDAELPELIIEAGTPIVSNAQSLLTSIVDVKHTSFGTIATADAKLLDLTVIGKSEKRFPYYVISRSDNIVTDATIYGCTCLEFDRLAEGYSGPLGVGDRVLIDNIGSYSNVLSPRFIQGTPRMYSFDNGIFTEIKSADGYDTVFGQYR